MILTTAQGGSKQDFRLDLAMIQNTLLVTPLLSWIRERGTQNYGRLFEQDFSHHGRGLEDSITHHRAILYNLGPLRIVVLCEVDAAVLGSTRSLESNNWTVVPRSTDNAEQAKAATNQLRAQSRAERELFGALVKQSSASRAPEYDYSPRSRVVRRGNGTLSSLTAEMVSCVLKGRGGGVSHKTPQMWLGRTPVIDPSPLLLPSRGVLSLSATKRAFQLL